MVNLEPASKTLNAIRSPLAFNALVALLLTGIVVAVLASGLVDWFRMAIVGFYCLWISALAFWVYRSYRADPRGLAYGPNEYLEESRMEYEHKLALTMVSGQTKTLR